MPQTSVTFKAGIAQYRLGKVVSAWRMNAISKWRYLLYAGRGIKIASVTSRIPHNVECCYKYIALGLLFPLHSWHCYVQTESNTATTCTCCLQDFTKYIYQDRLKLKHFVTGEEGCIWRTVVQTKVKQTIYYIINLKINNFISVVKKISL
jgi:hypothetical protein